MPRVRGDSVGVTPILRHNSPVILNNLGKIFFFTEMPLESTITTTCPNSRLVWSKCLVEPNNHLGIETSKPVWNLDGKTRWV
jgi:hypothetical protein